MICFRHDTYISSRLSPLKGIGKKQRMRNDTILMYLSSIPYMLIFLYLGIVRDLDINLVHSFKKINVKLLRHIYLLLA